MFCTYFIQYISIANCDSCGREEPHASQGIIGAPIPGDLPKGWKFRPIESHARYDSIVCPICVKDGDIGEGEEWPK